MFKRECSPSTEYSTSTQFFGVHFKQLISVLRMMCRSGNQHLVCKACVAPGDSGPDWCVPLRAPSVPGHGHGPCFLWQVPSTMPPQYIPVHTPKDGWVYEDSPHSHTLGVPAIPNDHTCDLSQPHDQHRFVKSEFWQTSLVSFF